MPTVRLNLNHYIPNALQFSDETKEKISKVFSYAMTHRAKILAVSATCALGVAYKVGILTGASTLIALAIIPIAYRVYQNHLTKNETEVKDTVEPQAKVADPLEKVKKDGCQIFYGKNKNGQAWSSSALVWIAQNKGHVDIPLRRQFRAIHFAILYDFDISVINSLITAGADLNGKSSKEITPLDVAIGKYQDSWTPRFKGLDPAKRLEIIKILINARVTISATNKVFLKTLDDPTLINLPTS